MNSISEFDNFIPSNFHVLMQKKCKIISDIKKHRIIVQEYENNTSPSLTHHHHDTSEELAWYQEQNQHLQKLQSSLFQLRLFGGVFLAFPTTKFRSSRLLDKVRSGVVPSVAKPLICLLSHSLSIEFYHYDDYSATLSSAKPVYQYLIDDIKSISTVHGPSTATNGEQDCENDSDFSLSGYSCDEFDSPFKSFSYQTIRNPCPHAKIVKLSFKDGQKKFIVLPDAAEFVEVIGAYLKSFNWRKVKTIDRLKELLELKQMNYDNDLHKHEFIRLLKRLWVACFNNYPTEQELEKCDTWKAVGFQSSRPSTDFRSMGLLGLWFIVYVCEKSAGVDTPSYKISDYNIQTRGKGWIQKMVFENSHQKEGIASFLHSRQYPFAVACINVAALIFDKLLAVNEWTCRLHPGDSQWDPAVRFLAKLELFDRTVADVDRFCCSVEEFFCFAMKLLDIIYIRTSATYMDFPRVMKYLELILGSLSGRNLTFDRKLLNDCALDISTIERAWHSCR